MNSALATVDDTGQNFQPIALSGGAYIANAGGALLLTDPAVLPAPAKNLLHAWQTQLTAVEVFGGRAAVNDSTLLPIVSAVGGQAV